MILELTCLPCPCDLLKIDNPAECNTIFEDPPRLGQLYSGIYIAATDAPEFTEGLPSLAQGGAITRAVTIIFLYTLFELSTGVLDKLSDEAIPDILTSYVNCSHGRSHYVAQTDLIDYQRDNVLTIDIKPNANPHLPPDKDCFKSMLHHKCKRQSGTRK